MSDLTQPPHVPSCVSTGEGVTVPTAKATPIYRFSLASWLSIYGRTCLMDFVKETDYAILERELAEAKAEVARITKQLFDQHYADTNRADAWRNEAETLRVELARVEAEREKLLRAWENRIDAEGELTQLRARVAELEQDKTIIDVPPQTIGDGTSSGLLSVFARGWNGYINTLREMHPTIQFREGCIDTSGRFHGDMSMEDVNAFLRAELKAVRKQANDEFDTIITRNMKLEQDKTRLIDAAELLLDGYIGFGGQELNNRPRMMRAAIDAAKGQP